MKNWKRFVGTAVMALALSLTTTSGAEKIMASSMHLGNESTNIINGGTLSEIRNGVTIFANTEDGGRLYRSAGGNYTKLSDHKARQINVIDEKVYYVTDRGTVLCYDLSNGHEEECFRVEAGIDEMYVNHAGHFYYLSQGDVYEMIPGAAAADTVQGSAEETQMPETQMPETQMPETEAAEIEVPETEAPETEVPETEVPETEVPETEVPETEAPETEAPAAGDVSRKVVADLKQDILHFIPTSGGMISAVGTPMDYTLYAGTDRITDSVSSFYTAGNYLILNCEGTDLQAQIGDLFDGSAADALEAYRPESTITLEISDQEDDCEICKQAAAHVAENSVVEDDWDLELDNANALLDGDALEASRDTSGIHRMLYDASVSEGQRNMVKRAYQMHLVEWTPLARIQGWAPGSTVTYFEAGTTYSGLPYGQPVTNSGYVPWDVSLEDFVRAVNDPGSKMYTSYSTYSTRAPYYSCDCSGFVSYAWQTPERRHTRNIATDATVVSSQTIGAIQVGDALNKSGSHVVMISDVGTRDGSIVYIDVIEQTPPRTRLTRYGEGGSYTLEKFQTKYFGNGYVLLRKNGREKVTYTPSKVVAVEGETLGNVEVNVERVRLDVGDNYKITYKTDETYDYDVTWYSADEEVAVVKDGTITAVAAGRTEITLRIGPAKAVVVVEVRPGDVKNFAGKGVSNGGIKLTWDPVTNANYYLVYRKNTAGGWTKIAETTEPVYGDMGTDLSGKALKKYTTYTYTVKACYREADEADLYGAYDTKGINVTTVTEAPVLTGVVATSYNSQTLVWKPVEGAEAYRVYRRVTGASKWTFIGETAETSYLNTNLDCGTSYTYTVTAYFVENKTKICSAYDTKGVTKVCCPTTPGLVTIAAVDNTTQQLTWTAVQGADGYNVYVKVGNATSWTGLGTSKTTSFTSKNLKVGTKYTYTVRAYRMVDGKKVLSGYNTTGKAKVCCPATPVLKYAVTGGEGIQKVYWNAVTGAEAYNVYRKDGDDGKWVLQGSTKSTGYTVKDLTPGVKYIYTVRAYVTVSGTKVLSDYNTTGVYRVCTFPAVAMTGIEAVDSTTQTLRWTAMNGAEGYNVYVKVGDAASWTLLGSTTDTFYTNSNLTTGTKYTYTVRAFKKVDGSRLLGEYNKDGLGKAACPKTPALGTIKDTSYTSQTVSWPAIPDADGYNVYMKTGTSTKWELIGSTEATSFRSVGLSTGTNYTYTIRAYKVVGETKVLSGYNTTGVSRVCVPAQPALESADVTGKGMITIGWNGVSGAQRYNVYRKTADTSWKMVGNTKSLTYTDTKLDPGVTYIYTVRAVRTVNKTDYLSRYDTKGISCKMEMDPTVVTAAERQENGDVVVKWNAVDFADGYILYCKEPGGSWTTAMRIDIGTTTSATLSTLDPEKEYVIRVRAFWKTANGNTYKGPDDAKGITVARQ